jgi:predicted regulator of Ras-like GTPase activity (Roadblock/LC7/MglB family)
VQPGSRSDRLAAALDEFVRSSPDVEAAAVVSFDGLPMASALPPELEEDRLGAMSAALLSLGEQAAVGLGRGMLNQIFVEGEHGFVFLMSARDQAVLTAIASRTAKIGFMLFEMRRAADRIGRALETSGSEIVAPEANAAVDASPAAPAPGSSESGAHGDAQTSHDGPEDRSDGHALDSSDDRPTWSTSAEDHHDAPGSAGAVHHLPPRSAASD